MSRLLKIFFALALCTMAPQMTFAARLFFDAKTPHVQTGERFEVNMFVNTEQETLNAFEGRMTFPGTLLDLEEIQDGNTIVNFWIEKPHDQKSAIIFSGVTPGGFNGSNGLVFSATFEARAEGTARFEINDAIVLRNDGAGSRATLTTVPFEMTVSKGNPSDIRALPNIEDQERPESFSPEIARDAALFDGKWFVVFATQDKSSGIDHYEIKESRQGLFSLFQKWIPGESPYIVKDQELRSYILVKAVDKAGNIRTVSIRPHNPLPWYENYEYWVIIILLGFVTTILATQKLWRRNHILKQ